ncbi:SAM-dependent methyltransferase [Mangrovitalea sediminis]|uniref:SAM-dependent methyltransferase n=1 Tax=Mangrovitalea sediminis TaxID=1982043 RepID=UPI000BE57FAD|nr:cyclopropane-fatty-acyl-phospholipid synthase family protein [Mangrovitalea sediminis]
METNSAKFQQGSVDCSKVRHVAEQIFRDYTGGIKIRLWDGTEITLGQAQPKATIVVNNAEILRDLAWHPDPLRLAEAYFRGDVDVEGSLYALLLERTHLQSLKLSLKDRISLFYALLFAGHPSSLAVQSQASVRSSQSWKAKLLPHHSKAHNREAIAFHYDVSNHFYHLWLDDQMVYSCAYFNEPTESIDQAQHNKLNHICHKLRLKAGERFLDVGCGWGALICHAAQHYGVHAHGITLSRKQYEYANAKIQTLGMEDQVSVELLDYRDLPKGAVFDKVASIGMFEHVGRKHLPAYFHAVNSVLKPGGLFLNHGITDKEEGQHKTVAMEFAKRYVFPDGELDSVSNVQHAMERIGFEICDVEALRPHYALTLRHWVSRLEAHRAEALAQVSEAIFRVWRLYMTACALQFESGSMGIYQILAAKQQEGLVDLPLTRRDLYQ